MMTVHISGAPCCWGVDDPKNSYLPPWTLVLNEASKAGFKGIELGPYGYMPNDINTVSEAFADNNLSIVAGTIFDDLVAEENFLQLWQQVDDICSMITKLPVQEKAEGTKFSPPFLVLIDWGHLDRDYQAGHPDRAARLSTKDWQQMIDHISKLAQKAWEVYGVRAVIHPHAGGYIEFEDEISKLVADISYETAGLCLDTGHLYYSKMDPVEKIRQYARLVDYIHFKDIDQAMYKQAMGKEIRFFDACAKGVMCPIGQGIIDYDAVHQLLKDIHYNGYITIEQERDPRNATTSLQDVKQSVDYLKRAGFGYASGS